MGGQTAIGYEQPNRTILYGLMSCAVQFFELRDDILARRARVELCEMAFSLDDYFSNKRSDEEDTLWRIAYMLDGTTHCSNPLMPGLLVFTPLPPSPF